MIVHCTSCEARFRVPDEKVGPRGARIRCTRCRTLFAVGPPPAGPPSTPAPEVELEAPARAAPPEVAADDPFAGFRLDAGLPIGPPRAEPSLAGDPFAAAGGDDREPLGAVADPFAAGGTAQVAPLEEPPGHADPPWGDAPPREASEAERAGDPGAFGPGAELAWADDPFAASISPRAERASLEERQLPLTDLADLLGDEPRPPAVPPPLPPPRNEVSRPAGRDGPFGPDLALEEPTTPPPSPLRAAADDLLGDLPFPAGEAFDAGPTELGPPPVPRQEEPLALATEPERGLPEVWRTSPAFPPAPEEVAAPAAAPAPGGAGPDARAEAAASARTARRTALRSIAVNAVSLAALLVVALAFRVLWRGEGAAAAASSPSALLRAILPGGRSAAPLETAGVTSGRYPRAAGAPLLLVRGEVLSRSPAPLARVRVEVEVLRAGQVLAHRSGLAGAVPTPEELHAVKDAAALEALTVALSSRARGVAPGEPVPFLVAFADVPEDLTGASVRVVATPAP